MDSVGFVDFFAKRQRHFPDLLEESVVPVHAGFEVAESLVGFRDLVVAYGSPDKPGRDAHAVRGLLVEFLDEFPDLVASLFPFALAHQLGGAVAVDFQTEVVAVLLRRVDDLLLHLDSQLFVAGGPGGLDELLAAGGRYVLDIAELADHGVEVGDQVGGVRFLEKLRLEVPGIDVFRRQLNGVVDNFQRPFGVLREGEDVRHVDHAVGLLVIVLGVNVVGKEQELMVRQVLAGLWILGVADHVIL